MSMSLESFALENTKRVLVVTNPQVREAIGHPSHHSSFGLRVAGLTKESQELRWAVRSGRNMMVEDLSIRFWNVDLENGGSASVGSTMEDPAFESSRLHSHLDLAMLNAMTKTLRAMEGNAKLARSHKGSSLGRWDILRVWASAIGIREVWIPMWPTFHNYTEKYHLVVDLTNPKSVQTLVDLDQWVNEIKVRERRNMTWDHQEYLRFAEHYGYQTESNPTTGALRGALGGIMSTKKKFMEMAEVAGIEVEVSPHRLHGRVRPFVLELDAPAGKIFNSSGSSIDHSIQGDDGSLSTDWPRACRELESIIAAGFDDEE